MQKGFVAKKSILILAPPSRVWEALIKVEEIKEYFLGTEVVTDWKVASPIKWRGTWQGKTYEDKGTILQVIPERVLQYTYWSSMGGFDDKPENYATVTYELEKKDSNTVLTVSQDNNDSESERDHSEKNWEMVLIAMKNFIKK
jgi:uncharacterized protein YndB with AHSA1/START domain